MNQFLNSISNLTYTENGALTHSTTGSALVDFFFMGGALRKADENRIKSLFGSSFKEDPLRTLKVLFYLRDIRGGQGERRLFRLCLQEMITIVPDWFKSEDNIKLIPEYGRWDDVVDILRVCHKDQNDIFWTVAKVLKDQLDYDYHIAFKLDKRPDSTVSLLAKWMPSEKAHDKDSKFLAKRLIHTNIFGNAKQYRNLIVSLREYLDILETKITEKNYELIDYNKIPSKAGLKYKSAFMRNDSDRYTSYLKALERGDKNVKMNTGALVPYDIVSKYNLYTEDKTLELAWKNLEDFMGDMQGLVIADVSGSMSGTPMDVCLSLAIYIAEHNKNPEFKDKFITFSAIPQLQELVGNTLYERIRNLKRASWDMNTDFQKVFDLVLDRAKACNVPQEDMPKMLIAISDMEFDEANGGRYTRCGSLTNFEVIDKRYAEAGYKRPTLVFWNVNSRQDNCPVTVNDKGVVLVSGYSPVILKQVLKGLDNDNMIKFIDEVINTERYAPVKLGD